MTTETQTEPRQFIHPQLLPQDWRRQLNDLFQSPAMQQLDQFLQQRQTQGAVIYPEQSAIFNAFQLTPFDQVKVVILGQDPYHGPSQAHGLSFSVNPGIKLPPSLRNIYRELADDMQIRPPSHGCLQAWAQQGVLLLNTVLTVEQGRPNVHQKQGWEYLTDHVIQRLNQQHQHLVFVLWGGHARNKAKMIDQTKHLVLCAPHPSPLSAHRGFYGSRPFSTINQYLTKHGKQPIDWSLPENLSCQPPLVTKK